MKKNLFALILFVISVIGCGTSDEETYDTSGFATVENTGFYTSLGYYGDDVIFGETTIVGTWVLYEVDSGETLYTHFYDDASMIMSDSSTYTYGVSEDGLSINISTGEEIVITTSESYRKDDGFDCYRVKIKSGTSSSNADMCPDH